jgi:lysophospholipid acyltransferase (LPLAT)-like uncharacterized protein
VTEPVPASPPRQKRWGEMSFREKRRALALPLIGSLGVWLVRALSTTWRISLDHPERFAPNGGESGRLVAMWHGRLLIGVDVHKRRGIAVLVSPSGDGELMHRLLPRFGYSTIRGSSNKQASRALREMLRELRAAKTIVITPDGPRGPRHGMNLGLSWMARATGFPIVTIGYAAERAWRLRSWDRFTIPKPFSRVRIHYGEPIHVDSRADETALAAATEQVRERLLTLEQEAHAQLGVPVDW